jgi:Na+-driven multidrug efflux pump
MTVEGVAIGTVGSQLVVAILILIAMRGSKGFSRLEYKNLRFYKKELGDIVKIGLPTAIQTSLFSISNVLISSAINSHGKYALEGAGGAAQIDAFIYTIGNAVANASMSIVSQNVGAKKMDRVKKVMGIAILSVLLLEVFMGAMVLIFSKPLISLFVASPEAFVYAQARVSVLAFAFIVDGAMEIFQYSLRAMGKSATSMLLAIFFVCIFRIIWLNTFYLLNKTYFMINLVYPISWTITLITLLVFMVLRIKKLSKTIKPLSDEIIEEKVA